MREKAKLEKLLEQEKHHNQTVMTLLEEKDNKIKDLENEIFNLNNEKLRYESEESEIEKERDYFRKKLDEFTDKFDKQQLELNALLNQKDQHLERIISDKKVAYLCETVSKNLFYIL
jgi:chromosome segregation ATPase